MWILKNKTKKKTKREKNKQTQNKTRLIDTENKLMVARWEEGLGLGEKG